MALYICSNFIEHQLSNELPVNSSWFRTDDTATPPLDALDYYLLYYSLSYMQFAIKGTVAKAVKRSMKISLQKKAKP
jgi:hypothetical protein